MRKLDEIFQNKEELELAEDILKVVQESIFQKKDVGVPFSSLQSSLSELGSYDKDGIYSSKAGLLQFVVRLIEEDYLMFHPNRHETSLRIGLSDAYIKHINYEYILDEGLT